MHKVRSTSYLMVGLIGITLAGLVGVTGFYLYKQSKSAVDKVIADDIEFLKKTLSMIDETCNITSIMRDRIYIDFLSIKKFAGNQIGALQVRYPEKWQGPYSENNPTVQGKSYELVKVKDGYAIVPGEGVKLANGKVMGKDIVLDASTELEPYLTPSAGLEFKGRPLAAKLSLRFTNVMPTPVLMSEV